MIPLLHSVLEQPSGHMKVLDAKCILFHSSEHTAFADIFPPTAPSSRWPQVNGASRQTCTISALATGTTTLWRNTSVLFLTRSVLRIRHASGSTSASSQRESPGHRYCSCTHDAFHACDERWPSTFDQTGLVRATQTPLDRPC